MAEEIFEKLQTKKLEHLSAADATCRVDSEIILPEYKAEAERIIRAKTKAVVKNKQIYFRDHALICEIEGSIGFHVLYQSQGSAEEARPSSFLHSESFFHSFQIPCTEENFSVEDVLVFAEAKPRSSLVKLLGPRKLSARSEVDVEIEVKCNQTVSMIPQSCSKDIVTRESAVRTTRLHKSYCEKMSFSQTIALPKPYLPIHEICEMEAVLFAAGHPIKRYPCCI